MKLRPLLSAGAIGTLLAAANAVPAYADIDNAPLEVSILESEFLLDSDTPDDLISDLGGDTDLITETEGISVTEDEPAIGNRDEPVIEYALEPGDEEGFPAQVEGEKPKLLDTADALPIETVEEPVEAEGSGGAAANSQLGDDAQDATEEARSSESFDDGRVNPPDAPVTIIVPNEDPSEPGEPTDSTELTEPTDPTGPEEPRDPLDPTDPTDSMPPADTNDTVGTGPPSSPKTQAGGQPVAKDARIAFGGHVSQQLDGESTTSSLPWDQPLGVQPTDAPAETAEHGLVMTGAVSTRLAVGGTLLMVAGAVVLLWRRRAN